LKELIFNNLDVQILKVIPINRKYAGGNESLIYFLDYLGKEFRPETLKDENGMGS